MTERGGDEGRGGSSGRRRLFVAVAVPEEARREIANLAAAIRRAVPGGGIRWVGWDAFHLTLRFLGETPEALRPAVEGVLVDVARSSSPFFVEVGEGGAFPSPRRPRVLWLAVAEGASELAEMARRLEDGAVGLGWAPEDRPYRAHLTLARCRDPADPAAAAAAALLVERARQLRLRWKVDRLTLFESHLSPAGARYEVLLEVPLGLAIPLDRGGLRGRLGSPSPSRG